MDGKYNANYASFKPFAIERWELSDLGTRGL